MTQDRQPNAGVSQPTYSFDGLLGAAVLRVHGSDGLQGILDAAASAVVEELGHPSAALLLYGDPGQTRLVGHSGAFAPWEDVPAVVVQQESLRAGGPGRWFHLVRADAGWPTIDLLVGGLPHLPDEMCGVLLAAPRQGVGAEDEALRALDTIASHAGVALARAQRVREEIDRAQADALTFRRAFSSSIAPMATLAVGDRLLGRFDQVNSACCRLTGYLAAELGEVGLFDILAPGDRRPASEVFARMARGEQGDGRGEARLVRKNGTLVWVELLGTVVDIGHGRPPFVLVHIMDVTDRRDREQRLLVQAHEDPLTGLANRRGLINHLEAVMQERDARQARGIILYGDLNGFKRINDRYGHAAGDAVLQEAAARLRAEVRSSDLVARLGGDEFAIVAPDVDPAAGEHLAGRIRSAFSVPMTHPRETVTISVGFAALDAASDPDGVLDRADLAMYTKKLGS